MSQHNGIEQELGTLKNDIKQIHADIMSLANEVSREGQKQWNRTRKTFEKNALSGVSRVADTLHDMADNSGEVVGRVKDEIGKRPVASFCAALGIGYFLGKLLTRE